MSLTDAQIILIRQNTRPEHYRSWADTIAFARAIERAVLAEANSDARVQGVAVEPEVRSGSPADGQEARS